MRALLKTAKKSAQKSILLALFALLGMLAFGEAQAANPLELNFWLNGPRYDGRVAPCESALPTITSQFQEKESTFWNSPLTIVAFDKVRQVAFRPWAAHTIPRRFCTAMAYVSDGLKHPIHYSIGEDTGMIGATFGVEWCVVGLDRNWAHNPACKMARP